MVYYPCFIFIFKFLFIFVCAGSSFLLGLFSSCSAWASHWGGSFCGAQVLGCTGLSSRSSRALDHRGLVAPRHLGSSWTKDWSHVSCIGRWTGFPCSSVGKGSACSAGDPGSIPGLGRSSGEGIGDSLQYSWAFLVVHTVKNLLVMWETWVQSLGWEDPLEKGGYPLQYSGLESSMDYIVHGVTKSGHNWATFTFTSSLLSHQGSPGFTLEF